MTHSQTTTKQRDTLHIQTNVGEDQNKEYFSRQLIEREKIKDTPFEIIGNKEEGYFIALGKFRLSETMSKEVIYEALEYEKWNYIVRLIVILIEAQAKEITKDMIKLLENKQDKQQPNNN